MRLQSGLHPNSAGGAYSAPLPRPLAGGEGLASLYPNPHPDYMVTLSLSSVHDPFSPVNTADFIGCSWSTEARDRQGLLSMPGAACPSEK